MSTSTSTPVTPVGFESFYEQIKDQPTFIVLGAQGSGTNLLSRILTRALDFSVTTDRSLIFNAAAKVCQDRTKERAMKEAKRVVYSLFPGPVRKRLLPKRYFNQNKNYNGIEEHLSNAFTDSPSEFANFFYSYHAFVISKLHKALKSDDIWENINLLPEIIPNYRVLLLIRDPRDNAISITNKNFGPCEIYHASHFVRKRMDAYIGLADRAPGRAMSVKYEDLLSDPIACVKRLEGFVGAQITPDVEKQIESLNIKRDNHQKWKKLPLEDLAASEAVFADLLSRFDYERGTTGEWTASSLSHVRRAIKDKMMRVPQKIRVKSMRYFRG